MPVVNHNIIMDNSEYGIYVDDGNTYLMDVDATYNYWGSLTGPNHESNPGGEGDEITDDVTYDPYYIGMGQNSVSDPSQILLGDDLALDEDITEVIIPSGNIGADIIIPDTVVGATLNVDAILEVSGGIASATLSGGLNLEVSTEFGEVIVEIPAGITISGEGEDWTGIIHLPLIEAIGSVSPTLDSGKDSATASAVIEIGFGDVELTFDKAVRVLIPGEAGKYVGYSRAGTFIRITAVCSADSQAAGDALAATGDCKIDVGNDLVVWTKHFTKFVTYTQTDTPVSPASPSSSSSSSGGSSVGWSPPCAPNWNCTEWSECSPEGIQIRECSCLNNCHLNIPEQNQSCEYEGDIQIPEPVVEEPAQIEEEIPVAAMPEGEPGIEQPELGEELPVVHEPESLKNYLIMYLVAGLAIVGVMVYLIFVRVPPKPLLRNIGESNPQKKKLMVKKSEGAKSKKL